MPTSAPSPNPRRVAAGKLNRAKRGDLTADGLDRLRQAAQRGETSQRSFFGGLETLGSQAIIPIRFQDRVMN